MKGLSTLVLALAVAASAGSDVNAASAKKKRVQANQSARAAAGQPSNSGNPTPSRSGDSYYENIIGSQVFGSQRWWMCMAVSVDHRTSVTIDPEEDMS